MSHVRNMLSGLLLSSLAFAANALEVGSTVPALHIESKGEYVLKGDEVSYAAWDSSTIETGLPALIFHMPARMSADGIIAPLRTRLDQEAYAEGSLQSISVVNLAEAMWGTAGLVASELVKNKRAHPSATIIADNKGVGVKAWDLDPRAVVVALVDNQGKIKHIHEGPMSAADVEKIITLLNAEIAAAKKLAKN
jgi:uncharacterized protein